MDYELALIDMDGTVYSGDSAIDGVNPALSFLGENDVETFFLTNYAGRKREKYSEKLEKLGLDISRDEVVTSGWLTAENLKQNLPNSKIFVLGEKGLKEEIQQAGLELTDSPEEAEVHVVSNKGDLSYYDLKALLQGFSTGDKLIGTNPDETIPGDDGEIPGAGTVISAVEAMTGADAEIIGKPSKKAVETVLEMKDADAEDCMMIGDRLNTDIRMAEKSGMESVLVLSGVTDRKEIENSETTPDHVVESIADLEELF